MAELSEALLSVLPSIRVPKAGDRVHKDECAFSFDTPVSSPRGRSPRRAGLLPAPTRSQPTRAPGVPPARGATGLVVPRRPGRRAARQGAGPSETTAPDVPRGAPLPAAARWGL